MQQHGGRVADTRFVIRNEASLHIAGLVLIDWLFVDYVELTAPSLL